MNVEWWSSKLPLPPSNSMEEESKSESYDNDTISETAPLTGNDSDDEDQRFFSSGCGCFQWRRWRRQQPGSTLQPPQPPQEEAKRGCAIWLREKAKKMKQLSEIVAGPRWKNFIRRNSNVGDNKKNKKKKKTTSNFQYDPRSYALNFDDGIDKEDRGLYLNFSGRYVVAIKP